MKCPNCNFEIVETTKFCPECGTKIPTVTTEATPLSGVTDKTSNTQSTIEANEQKPTKKNKIKKIIIISVSGLLACGIIFLILYLLNPFCMFGHRNIRTEGKEATCIEHGDKKDICDDCGQTWTYGYSNSALGHDFYYKEVECNRCGEKITCDEAYAEHEYKNVTCGEENTCVKCGKTETLKHEQGNGECKYCGRDYYTIVFPSLPITSHEYDRSNHIEQSSVITQIEASPYYDGVKITYTVKRTYHENGSNYSASAKFGWKLYDSDGMVIDSGTAYSDGNIKVGEVSKGYFNVHDLILWEEYKLEILNIS